MPRVRRAVVILPLALLVALIWGCSSDKPTEPEPGPDLTVASLTMEPIAVILAALGDTVRFAAVARNAAGDTVLADIVWSSTDPAIVVVDTAGLAESRGGGTAEIIATAAGFADTATVTVTLTSMVWAAAVSGDWHDPDNWRGGVVPTSADTAMITAPGDYEITLSADTDVARLVLGGGSGTRRLDTGTSTLTMNSFEMDGAELRAGADITIGEAMAWRGGGVEGPGSLVLATGAEMRVGGGSPTPELATTLVNGGTLAVVSGSRFDIRGDGRLENPVGSLIDFRSDGSILPYAGGVVESAGLVRKSAGVGVSAFGAASGEFSATGGIEITTGALRVAGGEIRCPVDIVAGARLEALGSVTLAGAVSFPGPGALDIDGSVVIGDTPGQTVTIPFLALRSGTMAGDASIAVTDSLIWVRGDIEGAGEITIAVGGRVRLVGDDFSKRLAGRDLRVLGDLTAGPGLDLLLEQGADVAVEGGGTWNQGYGGKIRQTDATGSTLRLDGVFTKSDPETTLVDVALSCAGSLLLNDGLLMATGAFTLTETSLIKGGGQHANPGNNLRLDVTQATAPVLAGAIEPDHAGLPAQLDIAGELAMAATTVVRIDLAEHGDIRGERLIFSSSVVMDGTLEITQVLAPEDGETFGVVSVVQGSGMFDEVTGREGYVLTQDTSGVRLYWPPPPPR